MPGFVAARAGTNPGDQVCTEQKPVKDAGKPSTHSINLANNIARTLVISGLVSVQKVDANELNLTLGRSAIRQREFARELGFIREIEILAALEASGMITTREHADLYADLSAVYCPVYQPRTLGVLTG